MILFDNIKKIIQKRWERRQEDYAEGEGEGERERVRTRVGKRRGGGKKEELMAIVRKIFWDRRYIFLNTLYKKY